jgi:hypothetical protein
MCTNSVPDTTSFIISSTSRSDVDERRPSLYRRPTLPQLLHRVVKCIRDGIPADRFALKQLLVKRLGDDGPVVVAHGPAYDVSDHICAANAWRTHHIVATMLLNPMNSIVAARCTAWSGWSWSPLAVSHALRNARYAPARLSCIRSDTEMLSLLRWNALFSGSPLS